MKLLARRIVIVVVVGCLLAKDLIAAAPSDGQPLFIAVGYALRRLTSTDGIHWEHEQASPEHGQDKNFLLRGVTYGKGRIVAVGGSKTSRILVSETAGREWIDASVQQNFVGDVAFGNDRFVTVGYQRSLQSSDGYEWSPPVRLGEVSWRQIAFGNGVFVAIGGASTSDGEQGWIATTPDGKDWSLTKVDGNLIPRAIAFGNDRFVIVGSHGLRQESTDGRTWEHRVLGKVDETLLDVVWAGKEFITTGSAGAYSSPDGANWSPRPLRAPSRLAFGRGVFVGVSAGRFSHSTDGVKWMPIETKHQFSITKILFVPKQ